MILHTCSKIEIPPKPSKKVDRMILIDSFFDAIHEIELIPFVISKKPLIKGEMKAVSIPKMLNIGENKLDESLSNPLEFSIDIMLEKITTNPPISKIVEMLLVILSAKISPRLEKVANFVLLPFSLNVELSVKLEEDSFFFQNLKINPTVIQARI